MKKYSTRDLSILAKLVKQEILYDNNGGILKIHSVPKDIWLSIEPIIEIRSLFTEGGGGVVKHDHPLYKIILNAEHNPQADELILIEQQQLKILKIINLFQNNLLLLIARGENK